VTSSAYVTLRFAVLESAFEEGKILGRLRMKFPRQSLRTVLSLFLGAFAKLRKATISFVMSVHLPVRPSALIKSATTGFS